MKIIESLSDTNIGGAGVLLFNRIKHTNKKKYKTFVVLPQNSTLKDRFKTLGINVIETRYGNDRSFDIHAVFEYIRIINYIKPHVINTHGCLSARIAAKICNVPVKFCTRHCVYPVSDMQKKISPLIGAVNSFLSDKFIAVAFAARNNLIDLGIPKKKINVIINGAEALERYDVIKINQLKNKLNIPKDAHVLTICARLEPCKDHICFFKALKILKRKGMNFVALVIGDGSMRRYLEDLCEEYGVKERVIFTGFVENVAPYINITDVIINCSVGTETSSLALSEGMSLGKPAIVSDYGGNPYMVKNGINGYIYKCSDYRALAERIECICTNRKVYDKMSSNAYDRFKTELNAEMMTRKTNELYDTLYYADRIARDLKMKNACCNRKIYKQ